MTKSTKAVLLSAFLFPGAGQLLLKRYILGSFLAAISLVALYFLLSTAMTMAQHISDQLLRGEIPLDVASILQAVHQVAASSGQTARLPSMVLIICWVVSVALAFRADLAGEGRA